MRLLHRSLQVCGVRVCGVRPDRSSSHRAADLCRGGRDRATCCIIRQGKGTQLPFRPATGPEGGLRPKVPSDSVVSSDPGIRRVVSPALVLPVFAGRWVLEGEFRCMWWYTRLLAGPGGSITDESMCTADVTSDHVKEGQMCMTGGSGREMARAGASLAEDLFSVKGRQRGSVFVFPQARTTTSFTSYVTILPY
jgi:hypothetical protein